MSSSSTTTNPNPNKHHIERFKKYFEPGDQSLSLQERTNRYVDEVYTTQVPYVGQEKAVIMLVGCPMSGKTTFAKRLHATLKKAVMMSRDFIRTNPQGVYTFDPSKEHKVYSKFFTQLEELYNNKSWNIIIVDDANCTKKQIIELLSFLEALEANIIPVVFEAPPKCMIESRIKTDNKGLDLEHVWEEAQGIYDLGELLFSVYNPIFCKQPKFEECKDSESFNANAIAEQYLAIVEVHKTLLSFNPVSQFSQCSLPLECFPASKERFSMSSGSLLMRRRTCASNLQVQVQQPRGLERHLKVMKKRKKKIKFK